MRLEEIETGDALHQAVLDAIARGDANAINVTMRALQEWLLFYAPELIAAAEAAAWRAIEELPKMDDTATRERSAIDALVVIEDMMTGHRWTTFLYEGDYLIPAYKLFMPLPSPIGPLPTEE